jgi:hypothetical protein
MSLRTVGDISEIMRSRQLTLAVGGDRCSCMSSQDQFRVEFFILRLH